MIKDFADDLDSWIDFVCKCRDGADIYKEFDIIKGKVANDKVFRVVDMYKRGLWDKERAIKEIRVYETYDQIVFISQKAIDNMLRQSGCYEVIVLQIRHLKIVIGKHLEEDIVFCLSERRKISFEQAMSLYYHSKLADRIHKGENGIQYLDHSILTDILEQELGEAQ